MRAPLSFLTAAILSLSGLAVVVPACDGGGADPNADADGDGHPASEDCDDFDADVHPGGTEPCSCDGKDHDCNGKVDDFACDLVCYPSIDADGDGFEPPADCNDQDPNIHPNAVEPCECDKIDQNCNGDPQDFACDLVCYDDKDNDGYDTQTDCDDDNSNINPGEDEDCKCDDVDQNCNGDPIDFPAGCDLTCVDGDGDGFFAGEDCDDEDETVNPDATEKCACDNVDQDCSGDPIDFPGSCALTCPDADGDGVPEGPDCDDQNPNAKPGPGPEPCVCDAADNDCNGAVDDFGASCMETCTYLKAGDDCAPDMVPYCGAGLACCAGGAGGPTTCVAKCTGNMCDGGGCPLVP